MSPPKIFPGATLHPEPFPRALRAAIMAGGTEPSPTAVEPSLSTTM
ncbi:hypothetical protein ABT256_32290 [Amycolatopsis japonica]